MKKYIGPAIRLTLIMILLVSVLYPLLIAAASRFVPGKGDGVKLYADGKAVGYSLIGQSFTQDRYFWGRPSAVNYNGAGSGGSNKGPNNPDYLQTVKARLDSFLAHNPGITASQVPAELITASGSGLDPDISPAAALVQVKRVARARNMADSTLQRLVQQHTQSPLLNLFGPPTVNVLQLNIALDQLHHYNHPH